jgi:hypothetical protein
VDQTQWYVWATPPPAIANKLGAAYGLYLLELGQAVLVTKIAWDDMCAGWGVPDAFGIVDWGFWMNPVVSGLSK